MNKAFVINVEIELVNDVVSTVEISVVIVGASLIDISILADRIDALKDADNSYDGYSTHKDNTTIETVFIVETDSIK